MDNDDSMESRDPYVRHELQQIKERVTTMESILAYVHSDELLEIVRIAVQGSPTKKGILRFCHEPRTKEQICAHLNLGSKQALDYHLGPLRVDGLMEEIEISVKEMGFIRARIIEKLPKGELRKLLEGSE